MNARFESGKLVDEEGQAKDAEFVVLSGGHLGKDEIRRPASETDKEFYAVEYEAFKNPPPPAEDKDAQIAELQAALAKASEPKK